MWPQPPPSSFPQKPAPEWDQGPVWAKVPEPRPSRFSRLSRRGRRILIACSVVAVAGVVALVVGVSHDSNAPQGTNGESVKDVDAILGDSALAFSKVRSFHLTTRGFGGEEKDAYDLHFSQAGTTGTLTAQGKVLDVVVLGDDAYLRGQQFIATFADPDIARLVGDRWVHTRTDDPKLAQYLTLFTLSGIQQVISQAAISGQLAKGSSTHVGGRLVIALTDPGQEIDVALDGRPYPVRVRDDVSGAGEFDFTEFDSPQPAPHKPAPQDIFGEAQQLSV